MRVALCNMSNLSGHADTAGCDLTPDQVCSLAAAAYTLSWLQAEWLLQTANTMAPFADKYSDRDYTIHMPRHSQY